MPSHWLMADSHPMWVQKEGLSPPLNNFQADHENKDHQ